MWSCEFQPEAHWRPWPRRPLQRNIGARGLRAVMEGLLTRIDVRDPL